MPRNTLHYLTTLSIQLIKHHEKNELILSRFQKLRRKQQTSETTHIFQYTAFSEKIQKISGRQDSGVYLHKGIKRKVKEMQVFGFSYVCFMLRPLSVTVKLDIRYIVLYHESLLTDPTPIHLVTIADLRLKLIG